MTQIITTGANNFYALIQEKANLKTMPLARRWTDSVLKITGHNLSRGARKALAKSLPKELADPLKRIFWLVHFQESELPAFEFQAAVARRAGASDPQFALKPIMAVFGEVKNMLNRDMREVVSDALPAEVAILWDKSG